MSTGRAGKAANKQDVIVLNSAGFTYRISVYNFQEQKMWNNNIEGKNDVFASTYPKFPTHKQGKSNFQSLCNSYCKHAAALGRVTRRARQHILLVIKLHTRLPHACRSSHSHYAGLVIAHVSRPFAAWQILDHKPREGSMNNDFCTCEWVPSRPI